MRKRTTSLPSSIKIHAHCRRLLWVGKGRSQRTLGTAVTSIWFPQRDFVNELPGQDARLYQTKRYDTF